MESGRGTRYIACALRWSRLLEPKPTVVKCRNWHLFEGCDCFSLDPYTEEEEVARNINILFAQ